MTLSDPTTEEGQEDMSARESAPSTCRGDAQERATESAVMPWVTWDKPIRYGPWRIYRNDFTAHPKWMTVAWEYTHDDYDGAPDAGDSRHGHCANIDACIAEIQEWEEDNAA